MSYFNKTSKPAPTITNYEGGQNFAIPLELELATLLCSTKMDNTFYESKDDRVLRLQALIDNPKLNKRFVAKAIIYARKVVGMRTVAHISAALLTKHTSGLSWASDFYNQTINRTDDISETLGAYQHFFRTGKKLGALPKAMKKGFSNWLSKADYYKASKYQVASKAISLIDLVNLFHIKNEWTDELMKIGKLKVETKEVKLSKAGQNTKGKSDVEKIQAKDEAYNELLSGGKMPIKALVMSLVRIAEGDNPETIKLACQLLNNREAIKKSLIHPLELAIAYNMVLTKTNNQELLIGLGDAIELCYNIPEIVEASKLDGTTCIFQDVSGSMGDNYGGFGNRSILCGLVCAIILKLGGATLIQYGSKAIQLNVNITDSISTIATLIQRANEGTEISCAFDLIKDNRFDRLVIITDQQDFGTDNNQGNKLFNQWRTKNNPLANVYSVDLGGYGNSVLNTGNPNVHTYSGFDANVVSHITNNKTDLVKIINETIGDDFTIKG